MQNSEIKETWLKTVACYLSSMTTFFYEDKAPSQTFPIAKLIFLYFNNKML